MTSCPTCARIKRSIAFGAGELAATRRQMRNGLRSSLVREYESLKARYESDQARLAEHQAEPHTETPRRVVDVRRKGKARDAGKTPCPVCRRPVSVLPSGFLRRHADPAGYPCSNRRTAVAS